MSFHPSLFCHLYRYSAYFTEIFHIDSCHTTTLTTFFQFLEITCAKCTFCRFFANFLTVALYTSFFVLAALDTMSTLRIVFSRPFRGSSTVDYGLVTMLVLPEQSLWTSSLLKLFGVSQALEALLILAMVAVLEAPLASLLAVLLHTR